MAANQAILDATLRHAVFLEQLKSGEVAKFEPFLKELDLSIRERLSKADLTAFSKRRLEALLEEVDSLLLAIFNRYADQLHLDLVDIANYEAQFEAASLTRAAPVAVTFEAALPGARAIRSAILNNPLSVRGADGGRLLKSFVDGVTATERHRLIGAIRQGFFEGQIKFQIIKNIRGTKALNYADGVLATTSRNAAAMVRTSVQHVATQARMETFKANADVVQAVEWVSTLDSRTTPQCRSLDKRRFRLDEGPRPPIHINCRSTVVAVTRFSALFSEGATRASKGASGPRQVRADQTYYEWLQQQPTSFQDKALGPARGKLFRNGGLSVERFAELQLGRNFKPLTLEQMKALEPLAFERAGFG
ncbi:minor capsid protein [Metapseudomonas otitidis]|uniref:minor capsid protein n=1 Tax=Metapseudomonas otitidis TaxID=319939 RepID=UPI0039FC78AB